jgi:hypothetical protein
MKKVRQAKCKKSQDNLMAPVNFSAYTLSRVFILILFFLVTPLVLFNLLWFFDVEHLVVRETFLNIVRLALIAAWFTLTFHGASKKILSQNSLSGFIFLGLVVSASQVSRFFSNNPDTNADSVTSHLLLTEAISIGWNPLKPEGESSKLIASSSLLIQTSLNEDRVESGIGFQTIQAFYNLLLGVESSYLFVNILFLTLTVVKLLEVFKLLETKKNTKNTLGGKMLPIGVVTIFLMSPIVTQQVNSAYTDLVGYCFLVSCILICTRVFLYESIDKTSVTSFLLLVILTPTIKLQLIVFMLPVIFPFFYVAMRRCQKFMRSSEYKGNLTLYIKNIYQPRGLVFTFVLLTLMYFPIGKFVSNLLKGKLPFLTDKSLVASSWNGSIPEFMEMNGVERVHTIITGRTSLNPSEILRDGLFSIPTRFERNDAGFLDSRIAGFGPLWGDLLFTSSIFALASGILVAYLVGTRKNQSDPEMRHQQKKIYFSGYLLVSYSIISVLMPLSFNARYHPQYIVMAFLSIYIILISMKIVSGHLLLDLIFKIVFSTLLLLIVLNFQIILASYLNIKGYSNNLIQQMKDERVLLQSSGEFKEVRYYFRNKTGLILATTGEISQESFSKNATVECKQSDKLVLITDETGVCGIR